MEIKNLVRKNIQALKPYSSARDEFKGEDAIFLDANENPYGTLNRYPDPYQRKLKKAIFTIKNISTDNIFIGNGSDEVIDLVFRVFCEPGKDEALTFSPTYGMYDVSAAINNVKLNTIALNETFQIDTKSVEYELNKSELKLILICTPNNPTANSIEKAAIEFILENFNGIVVIDEAYADFSVNKSWSTKISKYPNLIVSQTFSKAWGLAAARVGMAFASDQIIGYLNKIKPPYNVSSLNQQAALKAIDSYTEYQGNIATILNERKKLEKALQQTKLVKKVFPSDANFILIEVENADIVYKKLADSGIVVRNRTKQIENTLRITIGSPKENQQLIAKLSKL